MNKIVFFIFLIGLGYCYGQNNLISPENWTVGSGPVTGFSEVGLTANNNRVLGADPYGANSVLWQVNAAATEDYTGGWFRTGNNIPIDNSKAYRFSIWVKKTNSQSGTTYFGFWAVDDSNGYDVLNLQGEQRGSSTPFFRGDLPSDDTWFLLVAYIHPASHSGTTIEGKVYDALTGYPVDTMEFEYKFNSSTAKITQWAYVRQETDFSSELYFWQPAIYDMTDSGTPTVAELLAPALAPGGSSSPWATNTNGIHYNSGNVGIGTEDPGSDWKLAVNGKIRSKEIKVETGWADYVFEEGYQLPSLKEVEQHIAEKGHLIHIPSAEEVEANGIELGEMNKLLLEKIEELTLYMIAADKKTTKLQKANEDLMKEQRKTKARIQRLEKSVKN